MKAKKPVTKPIFWSHAHRVALVGAVKRELATNLNEFTDAADALNSAQDELFALRPCLLRKVTRASVPGIMRPKSMRVILDEQGIAFVNGSFSLSTFKDIPKSDREAIIEHIDAKFEELKALIGKLQY